MMVKNHHNRWTDMVRPPSVLIVDDEFFIADAISESLVLYGCNVVGTAESGVEAVTMARALSPDLVLMDFRLKGELSGVEAASLIQKSLNCTIIFLTGSAEAETGLLMREVSPYVLIKPIRTFVLLDMMEASLQCRLGTGVNAEAEA